MHNENQTQPPIEDKIRYAYNSVKQRLTGMEPTETTVIAQGNKIVILSKGLPAIERKFPRTTVRGIRIDKPLLEMERTMHNKALWESISSALECEIAVMQTDIRLADDELLEVFVLRETTIRP
ncbi:Na-translocating system protein MpsC family protein [Paenibacillus alkalitolerans]|uniref:Na-translocating system protein MpsC family protein n=1 Tax=Paenibacillus alkalitolerans TaxID=2799335 RepID=UPI0018F5244E|nr:Na-translocating system protein MpsC family protein [Paenibacillus alkalitolerans]